MENDEDVSLFVKNIENVQGDERDIIVFSTAYAKNVQGKVLNNFGPLNKIDRENRLNVAISRVKKKICLVTYIEPEDLSVDKSTNKGPKLFKEYLKYIRAVSDNNEKEQELIFNSLLDTFNNRSEKRDHDSEFESEVYEELVKRGYEVHKQVDVSGYRIDLAIYNKDASKYILGIECDGATYHSLKSERERDIHRRRYLESRGWKISRIWSTNWWRNSKKEIERIESSNITQSALKSNIEWNVEIISK
ncbi:AAA domain-containing protein [Clostridium sp.]|uniref:AAA domain-containing protein n=1 Tax=Clostridium sp. TaxID=1506 RepID=UPI003F3B813A